MNMPNSAAAAYTAACQEPANAGSKELPAALRYLAQYYLRFGLLDHASHYAYKCLEHEGVSSIYSTQPRVRSAPTLGLRSFKFIHGIN